MICPSLSWSISGRIQAVRNTPKALCYTHWVPNVLGCAGGYSKRSSCHRRGLFTASLAEAVGGQPQPSPDHPHLDTLPLRGPRASAASLPSGSAYPEVRAYRLAMPILLKRPKDLAEHVTGACSPQAGSPGIQGGKVGQPQGPSPHGGPWVPRP